MIGRTILYLLWYSFGTIYFIMALWGSLEKLGKSPQHQNTNEYLKHGTFFLSTAIISTLIDVYLIESIAQWSSIDVVILRLALFPTVLAIVAKITGPSRQIALSPTKKRK